ncbi:DUF305 domain-containing protein [Amycolatopsis anabasis]|uniref:DUF305 domain-containing protein n=1 Tax=Amycolatopsis anabasis TaxID=1840409 RepID=UPI00131D10CB|nr:DUF305 domain-containing protein [Amycolatopsis anabasis]
MKSLPAVLLVVAALTGCSGEAAAPPPPPASAPVVLPGKPGDPGTVVPPERAGEHRQAAVPNGIDVNYVTMMIPHHRQAITMTDLVAAKSQDDRVRGIADRIAAAQGAEIAMMHGWLGDHGKPVPAEGHAGHGGAEHGLMPGMATPAQLDELRAAGGREFDRKFLELMITHHQGALTMAEQELSGGVEVRAQQMAQEVITTQTAEIERLRGMLANL